MLFLWKSALEPSTYISRYSWTYILTLAGDRVFPVGGLKVQEGGFKCQSGKEEENQTSRKKALP